MTQVIHKFALNITNPTTLPLHADARVLHVGSQGTDVLLWVLMDADMAVPVTGRTFEVVATGQALADDWLSRHTYVGTCQAGPYVWHVWEQYDRRRQLRYYSVPIGAM